jgi:hypothetical protein
MKQNSFYFKDANLRSKYNISLTAYNEIFITQNGRCAICNTHQSNLTRPLFVDHDHKTNTIRGLLCQRCNLFLGANNDNIHTMLTRIKKYEENIILFKTMIDYLNKQNPFTPKVKITYITKDTIVKKDSFPFD